MQAIQTAPIRVAISELDSFREVCVERDAFPGRAVVALQKDSWRVLRYLSLLFFPEK